MTTVLAAPPSSVPAVRLDTDARVDRVVRVVAAVGLWLGLASGHLLVGPGWWGYRPDRLGERLTSVGRLTGLWSADLLLRQVLLMSRLPALEQAFGRDRLARIHRVIGFLSFDLMLAHIALIVGGYATGRWSAVPGTGSPRSPSSTDRCFAPTLTPPQPSPADLRRPTGCSRGAGPRSWSGPDTTTSVLDGHAGARSPRF